jgi:hypothetical protein
MDQATFTRFVADVRTYEQVVHLSRAQYDATTMVETAHANHVREQYAAHTAYVHAHRDLTRAMAHVYRRPHEAVQTFEATVRAHGEAHAVTVLYQHPDAYGKLQTTEQRRFFGLLRHRDDTAAREAAHDAATVALTVGQQLREVRSAPLPPRPLQQAQERLRDVSEQLRALPSRTALERDLAHRVHTLTPTDARKLANTISQTQLALVNQFKVHVSHQAWNMARHALGEGHER